MASDNDTSIAVLRTRIAAFASERDWGRFHSPKNLALALAVEVGAEELLAQLGPDGISVRTELSTDEDMERERTEDQALRHERCLVVGRAHLA